jgi:kelch-like protein 20
LGIRAFADTHSCRELLKIADKYLQNNFIDVVESDEFLLLPFNQLVEIISNDELNVRCEEQVYQACMNWLNYDLDERRPYLAQLMSHVRLPLLDTKFLVTKVGTDPLIRQDQICRDLIDEAKDYHLLPQERAAIQHVRTRPRKPVITGEVLFAVGGWCSGDAIASVEMYDPQVSSEWKIVAPMSKRRCGVGVGVLNDQIYAIGILNKCMNLFFRIYKSEKYIRFFLNIFLVKIKKFEINRIMK